MVAERLEEMGPRIFGIMDIDGVREGKYNEEGVRGGMGPVENEVGAEKEDVGRA